IHLGNCQISLYPPIAEQLQTAPLKMPIVLVQPQLKSRPLLVEASMQSKLFFISCSKCHDETHSSAAAGEGKMLFMRHTWKIFVPLKKSVV
ncbi:MAG: hypothetical protein WBZ36_09655, partial [Candidatus Nitrosopolaris sp.]